MGRYYDAFETPLGILHCLVEDEKISLLHPNPPAHDPSLLSNHFHPLLKECKAQIDAYFLKHLEHFSLPINLKGTPFTQNALLALTKIPFGETLSYGELARLIQYPNAFRAIGTALARNPLLLLLPCHRIICSNGDIGQYAWGRDKKEWLLRFERVLRFEGTLRFLDFIP